MSFLFGICFYWYQVASVNPYLSGPIEIQSWSKTTGDKAFEAPRRYLIPRINLNAHKFSNNLTWAINRNWCHPAASYVNLEINCFYDHELPFPKALDQGVTSLLLCFVSEVEFSCRHGSRSPLMSTLNLCRHARRAIQKALELFKRQFTLGSR